MIRLVLACAPGDEAEEIARAAVLEAFADGVEERRAAAGGLELAVYCADRPSSLPDVAGTWSEESVADGWEDGWRAFHTGRTVGGKLWVGPPWVTPPAGLPAVVIDPGQAFGTGSHATTLLCLELLLEQPPGPMLDLGCGSGVLAIAAARLGHAPVLACDDDPIAVEVAAENAAAQRRCDPGLAVRRALRRAAEGHPPVAREPAARAAAGARLAPRSAPAPDRLGPARGRGVRDSGIPGRGAPDAGRAGRDCCSSARRPRELLGRVPGLQDLADRHAGRARAAAGRRHGGGARGWGGARREHLLRHARGRRQEPQGRARRAPPGRRACLRHGLRDAPRRRRPRRRGRTGHRRARDRRGGGRAHRARARRDRVRRPRRRGSSARARSSRCRTAARSAARSA